MMFQAKQLWERKNTITDARIKITSVTARKVNGITHFLFICVSKSSSSVRETSRPSIASSSRQLNKQENYTVVLTELAPHSL
jgi:hypothetical protein